MPRIGKRPRENRHDGTYHDASSRTFRCECGARLRWRNGEKTIVCACRRRHRRGLALRGGSQAEEQEKARALGITRYSLWRYRQGMAGNVPPGRKPSTEMRRMIRALDKESREAARRERERRQAEGE